MSENPAARTIQGTTEECPNKSPLEIELERVFGGFFSALENKLEAEGRLVENSKPLSPVSYDTPSCANLADMISRCKAV